MSNYFVIPKNKIIEIPVELTTVYLGFNAIPCITVSNTIWTGLLSGFSLHYNSGKLLEDNCELTSYVVETVDNEYMKFSFRKRVL